MTQRRWWRQGNWWEGLHLSIEMWNGTDGTNIFSVCGPIVVRDIGSCTFLHIMGPDRQEVIGPAFSAASKDPGSEANESIYDYLSRAGVSVRVMVSEPRSGRMALLYQGCGEPAGYMTLQGTNYPTEVIEALPPDRHSFVCDYGETITLCTSHGTFEWDCEVDLIMVKEPDQAGQPYLQGLYRAAGGDQAHYSEHDAFTRFAVDDSRDNVGKCVMGLLWNTR
jgi:hypothetical protein